MQFAFDISLGKAKTRSLAESWQNLLKDELLRKINFLFSKKLSITSKIDDFSDFENVTWGFIVFTWPQGELSQLLYTSISKNNNEIINLKNYNYPKNSVNIGKFCKIWKYVTMKILRSSILFKSQIFQIKIWLFHLEKEPNWLKTPMVQERSTMIYQNTKKFKRIKKRKINDS